MTAVGMKCLNADRLLGRVADSYPPPLLQGLLLSISYLCTLTRYLFISSAISLPEKTLEVTQDKPKEDRVNITCEAEGVYPEPNMTITALESKHTGFIQVTTRKQNNSSLFDIKGTLSVDDVELSSPTTFVCELSIPDANYSNRRELVYFPGPPTTPSVSDHIAESLPSSGGKIGGGRVARLRPCTL
ncbi:hypothetical protein J6590_091610 [Homalodisca vitripennis]|nr:hypothetical protein J6590_091610 [Homalodisca vitripennis]